MSAPLNIRLSRRAMVLIACAIIALLFVLLVLSPLFKKARIAVEEAKALDGQLALVRQAIANARKIDNQGPLLVRAQVSQAIDEIIKVGSEHNINFLSTAPQQIQPEEGSKYPVLPIRMSIRSKFEDFGVFLGSLEKLTKSIVTVKRFTMERQPEILPEIVTDLVIEIHLKEGEDG